MKRKLTMVGIVGSFLVITPIIAILFGGITVWLLFRPDEKPQTIKITPLPPLITPVAYVIQEHSVPQVKVLTAAINQPLPTNTPTAALPTPTATFSPTDTPSPTASASPTPLPSPTATATPIVTQIGVATRLVIPRLNLDASIFGAPIENGTWRVDHLGQSIGHLEGTAPPGSESNIVLAGHVTLATGEYGPFAGLGQLEPGDMVTVYEGNESFQYMIDSLQVVHRLNVEVVYPSNTGQLTLLTCTNWDGQEGRYSDRVVVKGHLIKG